MTTTEKPVVIRRLPAPMSNGLYIWQVTYRDELEAQFTSGERALSYVDRELSARYRQKRDAQAQAMKDFAVKAAAFLARALAKNRG